MGTPEVFELSLQISANNATDEDVDRMTRELLSELRGTDVEWVELQKGGAAPSGTKSADAITIGSLAMAVLPSVLPKVVESVQAWAMRGNNRTVKFKGKIAGQPVEFEGSSEDLQTLLATLDKTRRKQ